MAGQNTVELGSAVRIVPSGYQRAWDPVSERPLPGSAAGLGLVLGCDWYDGSWRGWRLWVLWSGLGVLGSRPPVRRGACAVTLIVGELVEDVNGRGTVALVVGFGPVSEAPMDRALVLTSDGRIVWRYAGMLKAVGR